MDALTQATLAAAAGDGDAAAPTAWVLHDGKAGRRSQALGLAEATSFAFVEKLLEIRRPWSVLPPQMWPLSRRTVAQGAAALAPPWPDLVIGCGRNTIVPALAIRRKSGGSVALVHVQDPRLRRSEFNLLVVPEHDRLRGKKVIISRGAIHRVTAQRLAVEAQRFPDLTEMPRPIVTVLLGGSNKAYRLSLSRLSEIAETIAHILRATGGSALVTPSRRTGEAGQLLVRTRLDGLPARVWDGVGDNPYFAYLAFADVFLVTADSVSMIREAAATGKPVHILSLDGGNAKFARFHRSMEEAGVTRPFAGRLESWTYPIPDDTARAAAAVRALVLRRLGRMPGQ